MSRVLLLEDDQSLGVTLQERLEKESHEVHLCRDLKGSYEVLKEKEIDLAILDVGVPDGSGFELARFIKEKSDTPVVFVTAQSSPEERLMGYELGAEEYIPKPFHLREFLLRVKHVLENHQHKDTLHIGELKLDKSSHLLQIEGQPIQRLNRREMGVLWHLVKKTPQVISRDEILNQFWGEDEFPTNRTVDNLVVKLRQLLGEKYSQCIQSVRGVGYQWINKE